MSSWDVREFGEWMRVRKAIKLPQMSQREMAKKIGVDQSRVARWFRGVEGTSPPTVGECVRLADLFDWDLIKLLRYCGHWDEEIQRRVLVGLARDDAGDDLNGEIRQGPLAHLTELEPVLSVA